MFEKQLDQDEKMWAGIVTIEIGRKENYGNEVRGTGACIVRC